VSLQREIYQQIPTGLLQGPEKLVLLPVDMVKGVIE
jgi:hypothetical protein